MSQEDQPVIGATQSQETTRTPSRGERPPSPSESLEEIFQANARQVFAAAFRLTGNAQDAEDVLQTVFLRLVRRRGELDLSPHPGGYLHRAAVNGSLDLLRARARSRSLPLDELEEALPEVPDRSPEQREQDREVRRALRQAVLDLSPRSAEIFSLRYLEGVANQEIAERLGMTQTAVGVALYRARNKVQKKIRPFVQGDAP